MAAFYWRWTWPSGDRRGYKQQMDFECSSSHLRRIVKAENNVDDCVFCGKPVDNGQSSLIVWYTMYLPGKERMDGGLDYHHECFTQAEYWYTQNATRLTDRDGGGGGPPASTRGNPWDYWDSMA